MHIGLQEYAAGGRARLDLVRAIRHTSQKPNEELGPPVPHGDGPSRMQLMMRSLLAERFKLSVHRETREMPIYHLVVARSDGKLGPELKPSTVDCRALIEARKAQGLSAAGTCRNLASGRSVVHGWGLVSSTAGGQPLFELISLLSATVQRNVVDRTGLSGNFDIRSEVDARSTAAAASGHARRSADPHQRRRDRSEWSVDFHRGAGAARPEAGVPARHRSKCSSSITLSGRRRTEGSHSQIGRFADW